MPDPVDPRTPCLIGWHQRTWPPALRPLTVTGGLPYFGGPGSGYMAHSIVSMADTLRCDPGSFGMVSGVGMHMTKHVYGVCSTSPGALVPPDETAVPVPDAAGEPTIVDTIAGPATVVAYSIAHGGAGPDFGVVIVDVADGERAYAKVTDPVLMADAETSELVGRSVTLTTDGKSNVAVW